jgi:hypothetical protein
VEVGDLTELARLVRYGLVSLEEARRWLSFSRAEPFPNVRRLLYRLPDGVDGAAGWCGYGA